VSAQPVATGRPLGWLGIARLGLVQACLGAVVVLTTSTLNRVMAVELALPALVPGLLVALHYLVQWVRPRMGFGGDVGGRRTPWIVGGMAVLALGGFGAAAATAWMAQAPRAGQALAVLSFALIGLGVSAAGTSLLVLLAKRVDAPRRAPAATLVWVMMIAGFALTASIAGRFLDPYTPQRLLFVSGTVSLLAMAIATLALRGLEGASAAAPEARRRPDFKAALAEVWADGPARRFTVFVFVSMLAFSAQDLILEPFAGVAFGWTPGQTTALSGAQHGGVLAGMLLMALAGRLGWGSLRAWCAGGCAVSGLALLGLVAIGQTGEGRWLAPMVMLLGAANGAFSIAAIGSMMQMAGEGPAAREGVRMGLWGAAQALAFGLGGLIGAAGSDATRAWLGSAVPAYSAVFVIEAVMFAASAVLALGVAAPAVKAAARARWQGRTT
jgi:BCD family chlorophyll transporter-like MFS transporter